MKSTGDVIDNFLVWELCKQQGIRSMIIEGSADVEEIVEKVRQEYREKDYDYDKKISRVREVSSNPDHKVKMLEYCSWEKETVNVDDLGTTLPHAMGLPPEVISGSLPEVLDFVSEADPDEYRSLRYIMSLKEMPEVLDEFLPTIISPGKIIRRRDRMNKQHGERDWDIEDTWGAVHDANHRLVAKILAEDLEEIECYVGRPLSNKIHKHVKL